MKQSQPVGNIQSKGSRPRATVMKTKFKDLNIRLVFDVKGNPLNLKNTAKVSLGIVWVVLLMVMFVVCGTLNTIIFKFQNESYSKGTGSGPPRNYEHPFTQGIQMFIGMILFCLPLHWIKDYATRCGLVDILFPSKPSVAEGGKKKERTKKKKATHRPSTYLPDEDYLLGAQTPGPGDMIDNLLENREPREDEFVEERISGEEEGESGEEEGEGEAGAQLEEKLPPINQLLFLIPALCDLGASTLLYIGLIYTYASVYQMLRATVVVFTGILSILVLKADIWKYPHNWAGVFLIVVGTAIVGYSSIVDAGHGRAKAKDPILGALMVIAAQLVYAFQFVFEEIFLKGYDTDPLQVPGYEGYWGFAVEIGILFILYFIPGSDFGSLENFPATVCQAFTNPLLMMFILLLICNIGLYNFTGNWITQELSAATRTTIDCVRNVLVWVIQLARGRQEFSVTQLIGFIILVAGTFVYNQVGFNIICPCYGRRMAVWRKFSVKGYFWKKFQDFVKVKILKIEDGGKDGKMKKTEVKAGVQGFVRDIIIMVVFGKGYFEKEKKLTGETRVDIEDENAWDGGENQRDSYYKRDGMDDEPHGYEMED